MLASALHFADNTFALDRYPEPEWITPVAVIVSWCVVTAIALIALTRKRADAVFFGTAGIYSLVLLSGLLHYAFGAPMHMALRSNVTVLTEAVIGVALAGTLFLTGSRLLNSGRSYRGAEHTLP
jgi:ABC-type transport system involved in cytochrome c biogenesis permease subunit